MDRGRVVISKAGRDKGRYMVILSSGEGFASVADGRIRILEKPKRKNIRHLGVTGTVLDSSALESDRTLREAIARIFGVNRR